MPAYNQHLDAYVQGRRRIAIFAFMIVAFFGLLMLDLASAMPFVLTTSGWFIYVASVIAFLNARTRR